MFAIAEIEIDEQFAGMIPPLTNEDRQQLEANILADGCRDPLAGWMNREQQQVIEYLCEDNRILREKLGHKRLILNESQKRRLAMAAMKLGKGLLRQFGTLFSPDTLIRWHRWLVARRYDAPTAAGRAGQVLRAPGRAAEELLPGGGVVRTKCGTPGGVFLE